MQRARNSKSNQRSCLSVDRNSGADAAFRMSMKRGLLTAEPASESTFEDAFRSRPHGLHDLRGCGIGGRDCALSWVMERRPSRTELQRPGNAGGPIKSTIFLFFFRCGGPIVLRGSEQAIIRSCKSGRANKNQNGDRNAKAARLGRSVPTPGMTDRRCHESIIGSIPGKSTRQRGRRWHQAPLAYSHRERSVSGRH